MKGMVNRLVPILAGLDVPLIEPHRNSLIAETRDQLKDEILVLTRIGHEHMAGHNRFTRRDTCFDGVTAAATFVAL